jgi:hemin uptake protein HemP
LRRIDDYSDNYYRLGVIKPAATVKPVQTQTKVPSETLLGARKELLITHNGREYLLRVTQNGKLILTA